MARAFGDIEYKAHKERAWHKEFSADLVISEPEVDVRAIGADDEFLLLACDGVFDVLSSQQAVSIVGTELEEHGDVRRAAQAVVRACEGRSEDNITCLVCCFDASRRRAAAPADAVEDANPSKNTYSFRTRYDDDASESSDHAAA